MNDIIAAQNIRRRRFVPKKLSAPRPEPVVRRKARGVRRGIPSILAGWVSGLRRAPRPVLRAAAVSAVAFLVLSAAAAALLASASTKGAEHFSMGEDGRQRSAMAVYSGLSAPSAPAASEGESIPLDLTESFAWESYTVKRGDSISAIASARSLSMDAVIASNGITNAKRLQEGMVLRIPNMDGIPYTVRRGDSLSRISKSWGIPVETILDANDLESETIAVGTTLFLPGARMRREELKKALGELFIYPIRGRLTSTYGWRNDPFTGVRRFHAAIDLAAPLGSSVGAAMDGRVSALGTNGVYGNFIILSHEGGYQTLYAHLDAFSVARGARVVQGGRIGTVGNTGYSTGPHLHFALFKNGRALNPLEYLGK